jgi:hypothetical protein
MLARQLRCRFLPLLNSASRRGPLCEKIHDIVSRGQPRTGAERLPQRRSSTMIQPLQGHRRRPLFPLYPVRCKLVSLVAEHLNEQCRDTSADTARNARRPCRFAAQRSQDGADFRRFDVTERNVNDRSERATKQGCTVIGENNPATDGDRVRGHLPEADDAVRLAKGREERGGVGFGNNGVEDAIRASVGEHAAVASLQKRGLGLTLDLETEATP